MSANEHSMEVVEGLRVNSTPAPFLLRAMAQIVDMAILGIAFYVLFIILMFLIILLASLIGVVGINFSNFFGTGLAKGMGIGLITLIILGFLLFNHAYFFLQESKKGTTYGKSIFGISVISLDGSKATLKQCIIREALRYIDSLLLIPGLLAFALTEKKQRVGDLVAGTMVSYSRKKDNETKFLYLKQSEFFLLKEYLKPGNVSSETRKSYLADSKFFITSSNTASEDFYSKWLEEIKKHMGADLSQLEINNESLSLFFAEHCLQLENSNK